MLSAPFLSLSSAWHMESMGCPHARSPLSVNTPLPSIEKGSCLHALLASCASRVLLDSPITSTSAPPRSLHLRRPLCFCFQRELRVHGIKADMERAWTGPPSRVQRSSPLLPLPSVHCAGRHTPLLCAAPHVSAVQSGSLLLAWIGSGTRALLPLPLHTNLLSPHIRQGWTPEHSTGLCLIHYTLFLPHIRLRLPSGRSRWTAVMPLNSKKMERSPSQVVTSSHITHSHPCSESSVGFADSNANMASWHAQLRNALRSCCRLSLNSLWPLG